MQYTINDTTSYHINEMESLGWELTVCNALEDSSSAIYSLLKKQQSFGKHLINFLAGECNFNTISNVCEVGGGYGYIMRDLLNNRSELAATMIDISPFLLNKQKQTLQGSSAQFIQQDFFAIEDQLLAAMSLVIFNENIGDFPTVENISLQQLQSGQDSTLNQINSYIDTYGLEVPQELESFNINIGAIQAVEKICKAGVPNVYISEHSCEAVVPIQLQEFMTLPDVVTPEKIALKGHAEFTIQFSHLVKVAEYFGYRVIRKSYFDIIPINITDKIRFIFTSNSAKDEHEVIRQFVEDLVKYEALFLIK